MILAELRKNSSLTIPEIAEFIGKSESAVARAIKNQGKDNISMDSQR
jgi:DNA-binding Lrp family transcriptional regulator